MLASAALAPAARLLLAAGARADVGRPLAIVLFGAALVTAVVAVAYLLFDSLPRWREALRASENARFEAERQLDRQRHESRQELALVREQAERAKADLLRVVHRLREEAAGFGELPSLRAKVRDGQLDKHVARRLQSRLEQTIQRQRDDDTRQRLEADARLQEARAELQAERRQSEAELQSLRRRVRSESLDRLVLRRQAGRLGDLFLRRDAAACEAQRGATEAAQRCEAMRSAALASSQQAVRQRLEAAEQDLARLRQWSERLERADGLSFDECLCIGSAATGISSAAR